MSDSNPKRNFFFDRLWDLDPNTLGAVKGKLVRGLQFTSLVTSNFMANNSLLRAAALSFTTLLSFVPLFALTFAVLKGFGAQDRLAPLILSKVAAGSEVVVTRVLSYIHNTNMASLGAIGCAALLFTAISMLGSVEEAFNVAWGVTETRPLVRKFSDYLSVLLSAPLLLLATTSITTTLQSERVIGWLLERTYAGLVLLRLAPYLSVWIALLVLYILLPNTRVRLASAGFGAVLAGTLWHLAQWAYIHFQIGVGNYNAIYGTLAALPILMVWINVNWLIVLYGMEVVAAHQMRPTFRRDIRGTNICDSFKELLALTVLRQVARAFHEGSAGWGEEHLARRLGVPLRIMRDILNRLIAAGFLVPAAGESRGYYPARELDRLTLDRILFTLRSQGGSCPLSGDEQVHKVLATADRAVTEALGGLTLTDLFEPDSPPPGVDKEGGVDI